MDPVVTLTTDFGRRDPYVAAMKGVIAARCPAARIHDLSHELPAGDVFEAALFLAAAIPWFPPGTVHVVVVDPGVGTKRRPVAARWQGHYLVLPDNGLITFVHRKHPSVAVRQIQHDDCRLESVSATFHGRDIFAPTAAALACGFPFDDVGSAVPAPIHLKVPEPTTEQGEVLGQVIHVDRFGNAITNIALETAAAGGVVRLDDQSILIPIRTTYGDVGEGESLALIGSGGLLEIAINCENASERLRLRRGSKVRVQITPRSESRDWFAPS